MVAEVTWLSLNGYEQVSKKKRMMRLLIALHKSRTSAAIIQPQQLNGMTGVDLDTLSTTSWLECQIQPLSTRSDEGFPRVIKTISMMGPQTG